MPEFLSLSARIIPRLPLSLHSGDDNRERVSCSSRRSWAHLVPRAHLFPLFSFVLSSFLRFLPSPPPVSRSSVSCSFSASCGKIRKTSGRLPIITSSFYTVYNNGVTRRARRISNASTQGPIPNFLLPFQRREFFNCRAKPAET